jgi:hypothetical protein
MGKLAGGAMTKVGYALAAVGSVQLVDEIADPNPTSIEHNAWEFGVSVPAGAVVGATAGVLFPQMAGKGATQAEALRAGAAQGALSAPIVAVAGLLIARRLISDVVTPDLHRAERATTQRERP